MYEIQGKHSIIAAIKNSKRKSCVFSGTEEQYQKLQLHCEFKKSKKNVLETQELFIEALESEIFIKNKIILLDQLENIGNIASIIRSAAILNYGVILKKCSKINTKLVEMACGGMDSTSIFILNKNVNNFIEKISQKFTIYGLDEQKNHSIPDSNKKKLLIVGSEERGISQMLKKYITHYITLRGKSDFNTFNASIAASIAMYIT